MTVLDSTLHITLIHLALQAELKRLKIKDLKDLIDEKIKDQAEDELHNIDK